MVFCYDGNIKRQKRNIWYNICIQERRRSMNIEKSKRLTNTVAVGMNNFIILNQNGYRENIARNLVKTRKDNIFYPIGVETESKQKSEE